MAPVAGDPADHDVPVAADARHHVLVRRVVVHADRRLGAGAVHEGGREVHPLVRALHAQTTVALTREQLANDQRALGHLAHARRLLDLVTEGPLELTDREVQIQRRPGLDERGLGVLEHDARASGVDLQQVLGVGPGVVRLQAPATHEEPAGRRSLAGAVQAVLRVAMVLVTALHVAAELQLRQLVGGALRLEQGLVEAIHAARELADLIRQRRVAWRRFGGRRGREHRRWHLVSGAEGGGISSAGFAAGHRRGGRGRGRRGAGSAQARAPSLAGWPGRWARRARRRGVQQVPTERTRALRQRGATATSGSRRSVTGACSWRCTVEKGCVSCVSIT